VKALSALLASTVIASSALDASRVAAEPQGNVGLTLGGAAAGARGDITDHAEFHIGMRGDVVFGRQDGWDVGVGPYLEMGSYGLDELQVGGGATLLLPVHDALPLLVSFGAFGRLGDDDHGLEPGLCGALFWGSRSYNFHAGYVMAAGLLVGYRQVLGGSHESALLVAAQIDLVALGLPLVALINLMRGPSGEAAPIER